MKKITFLIVAIVIAAGLMSYDILSDNGIAGRTGSPGESDCTSCHSSFALNTGGGSITITAPTLTGWQYVPGSTYTISVTVARTGNPLFGVDFEALQSSGANAGTLTITNSVETQIKTKTVSGNVRNNVVHQLDGGLSNDSHTFTFDWTAPTTNVGDVTFYAAGIAANGTGGTSGDYVYTTSQVVTPLTTGISDLSPGYYNISISPNPVAENFTLNYNLTSDSKVIVKLISLNGQMVQLFIDEEKSAGSHSQTMTFDHAITKGVYFISVDIDGAQHIQKIIIQ